MSLAESIVNNTLRGVTRVLCRVDDSQLARVPLRGPLILVANHINFLEVPLLYTHLLPRPITGFAKAETWNNPALRPLFNLWKAIPLKRGEADVEAVRMALSALNAGRILAVAPEGTRSGDGRLKPAHPGVVTLALRSGAPLLPLVYYGGEQLRSNVTRLRRTDFHIAVGRPFVLRSEGVKINQQIRQEMLTEIMLQLAALLPPYYQGFYAGCGPTARYLHFLS